MRVEIMGVTNGVPNGDVLGYGTVSADDLQAMSSGDPLSFNVALQGDIYVTAGSQYAIVVNYLQYSNTAIPHGVWSGANGKLYSGGSAFTAAGDTPSNWTPVPNGLDLHFRTFVLVGVPVSDLSIVRVSGPKRAHACQIFREAYRVTNLGPDPATRVQVSIGGGDQFGFISVNGVPGNLSAPFNLAAGQSKTIVAYFKVVAFVPGETRDGFISATIGSDIYPDVTFDPNPNNNAAGTSVWLVGQPSEGCTR